MKITVSNLGPIREAKNIEISPMTIFVGPSNTGKSYLAMLVYAIHKAFADDFYFRRYKGIVKYMEQLEESQKIGVDTIQQIFQLFAKAVSYAWKEQMMYCFGEEGKKLIDADQDQSLIVKVHSSGLCKSLALHSPEDSIITKEKCRKVAIQINEDLCQSNEVTAKKRSELPRSYRYPWSNNLIQRLLQLFREDFMPKSQQDYSGNAYYLPAIRGGIMQIHLTMVSAVIEQAPMVGLTEGFTIPKLNGVLSDFLKNLINIRNPEFRQWWTVGSRFRISTEKLQKSMANGRQKIRKINKKMEQDILSGKIEIQESETQYPDFRYSFAKDGKKLELPLMRASSSVSELAPVSLFIRHYLKPYDLFILEEPEAHLHPGAQRQISEVLVSLVNAGVNVLVTTHSDNILEQISNYIYADQADIGKTTRLVESKCSTYQFKPGGNRAGTKVEKIQFNPDTGIVTADHLKVASELYNETVTLMEQSENGGD